MTGSLRRRRAVGYIYLALVCLLAAGPLLIRFRRPAEIRIVGQLQTEALEAEPVTSETNDDASGSGAIDLVSPQGGSTGAQPQVVLQVEEVIAEANILVHVAGNVVKPGLYGLPEGSRVHHAVEAAGGFSANADKDAVNIALPVTDGQQVYIRRRETKPSAASVQKPAAVQSNQVPDVPSSGEKEAEPEGRLDVTMTVPNQNPKEAAASSSLVDINSASSAQLEDLPGIGPSTAAKIIAHRKDKGPFTSIEGLMDVSGIGPAKFAALKDLVTAK